jgi:uncharacterized protein (DUF58 family)
MVLSGRLVALAVLGVLAAIASTAAALLFAAALAALVVADLGLAARIADVELVREPSRSVRLGEAGETVLHVTNGGRRTLHALVRDAWVPSAGTSPRTQSIRVGPGERRTVRTTLRRT